MNKLSDVLGLSDFEKIAEIQKLLDEMLEHYLTYEGHCKSSEGHVSLEFGNSWERREGFTGCKVYVYSYIAPTGERSHTFDSVDEALEAVRGWHAEEMSFTPDPEYQERSAKAAEEFLNALGDRVTVIEVNVEDMQNFGEEDDDEVEDEQ